MSVPNPPNTSGTYNFAPSMGETIIDRTRRENRRRRRKFRLAFLALSEPSRKKR